MLSVDEALARVMADVRRMPAETVSLLDAQGRVLAVDVAAPRPLPPWPASAMDGYAVRAVDVPGVLDVLETVAAGGWPSRTVGPWQATRIMTGAPVPAGADAVVMVEDTALLAGEALPVAERVDVRVASASGRHVRARGCEVDEGSVVLTAGTLLTAGALALLAGLGIASVEVRVRPRVAILTTGDEVVAPGVPLGPGQIHGSNDIALAALVRDAGAEPVRLGNVRDDPDALRAAFTLAAVHDVVVSTGGVSVGDFDHVKGVFADLGGAVTFWRVAMKPGKPLAYGSLGGVPVFGLPGNPISCMVNFLLFVRPVLRTMLGDPRPHLPELEAELAGSVRRAPGRFELVRVALARDAGGVVRATVAGPQGSASLLSMSGAHGLALVAADAERIEGRVRVLVFDPSWEARPAALYA